MDDWVRMEDYAKLHDERRDLEDALNALLEADGFDGRDQDAYWARRNELMAAGQAWRARMEIIPKKAKVTEVEYRARMLGFNPGKFIEWRNAVYQDLEAVRLTK